MGFRNYIGRTVWVLVVALAVGIVVAIMGGEERSGATPRNTSSIAPDVAQETLTPISRGGWHAA